MDLSEVQVRPRAEDGARLRRAQRARRTLGISPASLMLAYADWLAHFAIAPDKHELLARKAVRQGQRLVDYAARSATGDCPPCIEPLVQDRRFSDPLWRRWPYNVIQQGFLLFQQWIHNFTTDVRGVSKHHEAVTTFVSRQLLDMAAPSNFVATNPEVLARAIESGGASFHAGWLNFLADWERLAAGKPPVGADAFVVGENVAVTPGKVVFRSRLIELIQYEPATLAVHPEPVLVVPAWIMKYYILDLSPHNSLVKYLVDRGHTVFAISWKNPTRADRDLGMDHYLRLGLMDAIDAVSAIVPGVQLHAAGYCIGGTLLAIGAAAMARDGDARLKTVTLLTAQTDFTEPGELGLFIDESEVTYLEDMMWEQGYLDMQQMAGAFQLLRSNDLVWSRMVREYLLGDRAPMTDLMAWNADGTRLPYRMHSEYLRGLYLRNDLAAGRFEVGGRPVALTDLRVPIFSVGTERDHVAPWRSVYKLHLLTDAEITFVVAGGGHNTGVVSEPGHPRGSYRVAKRVDGGKYVDPGAYLTAATQHEGSWWPEWQHWLVEHSGEKEVAPPTIGAPEQGLRPLGSAPGTYVLER
jgi:polyhydroxyalkanoate synthase